MADTIVAVFGDYSGAQRACDELAARGFAHDDMSLSPQFGDDPARREAIRDYARENGGMLGFFRALFGVDDGARHLERYADAMDRGGTLLTLRIHGSEELDRADALLRRLGAEHVDAHRLGHASNDDLLQGAAFGADDLPGDIAREVPDDRDVDIAQERQRHASSDLMTGAGRPLDIGTRSDRPLPK